MRGDGLRVRVALWEDRRTPGPSRLLRKGGSNDGRCLFRIDAWNGGSRNTGRPPGLPTGPIVLLTISVVFVRLKVGGYLWFLLQYGTVECAAAAVGALGVDDVGLTGDKLDLEPAAVARIVDIPGDAATGLDTAVSISGGGTLDGAVPRGLYYCEGRHIADSQTNDGEEGDDPRLTSTVTEAGTHYVSARCAAAENSAKRLPQRCVLVLPDRSLGQWNSVRHSVSLLAHRGNRAAGTAGARSGAVLEAPAFVAGLDDLAMMSETIEQGCGHLGVAEDGWPFAEGEVCGDDDRGALVEPAHQMEEQLPAGLGEGQVAEFVEDDEVAADELVCGAALAPGAEFGLEVVDQVDDVVAAASGIRLSDALALAAQRRSREHAIHDATLRGFMLRVRPDGSRLWVLRLRRDGKPRRVTFGTVTVDQTRAAASVLLAREKRGGRTILGRLWAQRLRVSRKSMSSIIRAHGSRPRTRRA